MIDDKTVAVRRELYVEFEQECVDGRRGRRIGGERDEDISGGFDEFEELDSRQGGAKGFELRGEE